jgi:hypothetical protein
VTEARAVMARRLLVEGRVDVQRVTPKWVLAVILDATFDRSQTKEPAAVAPLPVVVEYRRAGWRCTCHRPSTTRTCAHIEAVQLVTLRRLRDHLVTTPPLTSSATAPG